MEIKEIIESAIRGGWSNYDSVTDIACSTVRFDEGNSSTDLFKILLEKDFWEAVGKDKVGKSDIDDRLFVEWQEKMKGMILHIIGGGTAESYIKNL